MHCRLAFSLSFHGAKWCDDSRRCDDFGEWFGRLQLHSFTHRLTLILLNIASCTTQGRELLDRSSNSLACSRNLSFDVLVVAVVNGSGA